MIATRKDHLPQSWTMKSSKCSDHWSVSEFYSYQLSELTMLKESAIQKPTKFQGPHCLRSGSTVTLLDLTIVTAPNLQITYQALDHGYATSTVRSSSWVHSQLKQELVYNRKWHLCGLRSPQPVPQALGSQMKPCYEQIETNLPASAPSGQSWRT